MDHGKLKQIILLNIFSWFVLPSLSQGARNFHGMHSAKLMEVKRKRFVVCSLLRKCQESFEIPRWLIRNSSRVSAWFKKSRCLWSIRRMILILELHDTQLKKGFQCNSNSNTSASQQQWAAHTSVRCRFSFQQPLLACLTYILVANEMSCTCKGRFQSLQYWGLHQCALFAIQQTCTPTRRKHVDRWGWLACRIPRELVKVKSTVFRLHSHMQC